MKKPVKKSAKKVVSVKTGSRSKKPSRRKTVAKVAGAAAAVGLGAVIYKNRERVKQLALRLFAKVNPKLKKTA